MTRRFQFSLGDVLLGTAVAAAMAATIATGQAIISFIAFSLLLIFIWRRPIVFRFWLIAAIGFGSALVMGMMYRAMGGVAYNAWGFRMASDELAAWGAAMVAGGFAAWRLFLSNPPRLDDP